MLYFFIYYRINIKEMDAVIGRGGLLKPIFSGTYNVNDKMLKDLKKITGKGGFVAYLDTNYARIVEEAALKGEQKSKLAQGVIRVLSGQEEVGEYK